ncbi:MAG: hypothetical protein ACREL5_04185 [Gemmatimonadales bacterium]
MANDDVSPDLRKWVLTWQRAAAALQEIADNELQRLDTRIAIEQLGDAFNHALDTLPPRTTSGLVEQQRIYSRLRRDPPLR